MLSHLWHDSKINQMPQDGQIGKYIVPKGYVNATQMAQANQKLLSDYMRLKSTKEYLQTLANDMGIPISSLVVEIQGYGSEQSTWLHPEVAIDVARWVSIPFRIWANRTLMKVMMGEVKPVIEELQSQDLSQLTHLQNHITKLKGDIVTHEKAITQHQQAIAKIEKEIQTTDPEIASLYIKVYSPIREKLDYYEALQIQSSQLTPITSLSPEIENQYIQHIQRFLKQYKRQANADKKEEFISEFAKFNINRIDADLLKAYLEKHYRHITEGAFEHVKLIMASFGYSYDNHIFVKNR